MNAFASTLLFPSNVEHFNRPDDEREGCYQIDDNYAFSVASRNITDYT